jgi:hypothetical protein
MPTNNSQQSQQNREQKSKKSAYKSPRIMEMGSVEELTHGSREQTSDEPGSGYKGG